MTPTTVTPTILCMSSYYKGNPFLEEARQLGARVILLTLDSLKDEAWARDAIDEFHLLPVASLSVQPGTTYTVAWLARTRAIDCIVALDDFDVETAADLREHMRLPGLGASAARFYRDKLAMRMQAEAHGVLVPPFVSIFNEEKIGRYLEATTGPWVLKPRSEASAMGIHKIERAEQLWPRLNELGDRRSFHLLEKFIPGDVFHVDSVVWNGEIAFVAASKYGKPPMTVYQGGGVFATSTVEYGSAEETALLGINGEVLRAMGMQHGVTHAEFIRGREDGRYYFLEIAARVGGAGIDQMVEQATGVNLWREWARVEIALARGEEYTPPERRSEHAGLMVSLARQEWPDMTVFDDPEVVWRLYKKHHVGLIVRSSEHARVQELLGQYAEGIARDFTASQPPLEHAPR